MSRIALWAFTILAALAAVTPHAVAREVAPAGVVVPVAELLVFEVDGCIYCRLLRRDVVPAYQRSTRAERAPIRFIDLNSPAAGTIEIIDTVTTVPTLILMKDGREAGRISGYTGPETFNQLMGELFRRID